MERTASFGYWLRRRRKALDLTQEALAKLVGCAAITIRKIEADELRPSEQISIRLASSLALAGGERSAFLAAARTERAIDQVPLDVRPVASDRHAHNFLPQPNPLIGREQEIATICGLLRRGDVQVLTLSGPGGTGKTRLAIQSALALLGDFAHGAWFVGLAPISDPALVLPSIAQTLGVKAADPAALAAALAEYLEEKVLLLLIDNFEQVLPAAPQLAALLASCPSVKALVTSRARLNIVPERQYAVPPLVFPAANQPLPPERLAGYEAVRLFVARARTVQPGFDLTGENAAAVAGICARLDGLPLAIELAAARTRLLPPAALLARLGQRLPLLTGGPRDLHARQRTLRDTIAWSYNLLDAPVQAMFCSLSVFVGGWALLAAEALGAAAGMPPNDVLDAIAALLDHNLLREDTRVAAEPRWFLLETIREYAQEQLAQRADAGRMQAAHAAYFLALAEEAEPKLYGHNQLAWFGRIAVEHDNMRAALAWLLDHAPTDGMRLASALAEFWNIRGHTDEGRQWLEAALAATPDAPPLIHANALHWAAWFAWGQGEYGVAKERGEQSLAIARAAGDSTMIALACDVVGSSARAMRNYDQAMTFFDEGMAHARGASGRRTLATLLLNQGAIVYRRSDYVCAQTMFEESSRLYQQLGDRNGLGNARGMLAMLAQRRNNYAGWEHNTRQQLADSREIGDPIGIASCIGDLGTIAWQRGEYAHAAELLQAAFICFQKVGMKRAMGGLTLDLGDVAWAQGAYAAARDQYERADALLAQVADRLNVAWARAKLGRLALAEASNAAAHACYAESVTLFRATEFNPGLATALCGLGLAQLALGDRAGARAALRESLRMRRLLDNWQELAETLRGMAALSAACGQWRRVAWLLGAEGELRAANQLILHLPEQADYDRICSDARIHTSAAAFAQAWNAGCAAMRAHVERGLAERTATA